MPTFHIGGSFTIDFEIEIEAESREDAEDIAREIQVVEYANNTIGVSDDRASLSDGWKSSIDFITRTKL